MGFTQGSADFFNARSMDVLITKLRKKPQDDPEIQNFGKVILMNILHNRFRLIFCSYCFRL